MDRPSRRRTTLDGQLADYWAREAARLDALALGARFGWMRRRYARMAERARASGERSRAREAARATPTGAATAAPARDAPSAPEA